MTMTYKKEGKCSLCGGPYELWGHNPDPLGEFEQRCCTTCNNAKVIPARLSTMMVNRDEDRS